MGNIKALRVIEKQTASPWVPVVKVAAPLGDRGGARCHARAAGPDQGGRSKLGAILRPTKPGRHPTWQITRQSSMRPKAFAAIQDQQLDRVK